MIEMFVLVALVTGLAIGFAGGMCVKMSVSDGCRWCENAHKAQDHDSLDEEYGKCQRPG